ncbi:MAG: class I SAM-dependent methyltransferase [Proteobacteria bacterium]|jgi:SAM-dependent methyltransferase|nr:class I SAM-dependent methyltransferase [Pseudomonadota bacterium]
MHESALEAVAAYYSARLQRHGATPAGVDWPHRPGQELRWVQLLKLCEFSMPRSLNDVGCGYGALRAFLSRRYPLARIDYVGTDISEAMVAVARRRWRHRGDCRFEVAVNAERVADYSVASGIFNVKLDCPDADWEDQVARCLDQLQHHSRLGYAINFVLPAADKRVSPPQLYRPAPERWLTHLQAQGGHVQLIQGYGLQEYTLLTRFDAKNQPSDDGYAGPICQPPPGQTEA